MGHFRRPRKCGGLICITALLVFLVIVFSFFSFNALLILVGAAMICLGISLLRCLF